MLTVRDYERREQEGIAKLPNRSLLTVEPVAFGRTGYPTRVRFESELWKYLDVMHETRFERDLDHLLEGGLTPEEFGQMRDVAERVRDFSMTQFSRPLSTRSSLLRSLNIYNELCSVLGAAAGRVFEIGPGSGYVGCLLMLNGWSYASTDVAQAFYLLQNRLWHSMTNGRVAELATDARWDGGLVPGGAVHFPWWEFFRLLDGDVPSFDIVTCNHALAEMHPDSLSMALIIARKMLSGAGVKAFVFQGWGKQSWVHHSMVSRQFHRFGFRLVHNDDRITVFVPEDNENAAAAARLPRLMRWSRERRALLVTALKCRVLGTQEGSLRYWPPVYSSTRNPLSRSILAARRLRTSTKLVGARELVDFYITLMGEDQLLTPDEAFLRSIGQYT